MTIALATRSRVLQFSAGPNEHRFYACERHEPDLLDGNMPLFFGRSWDVSEPVAAEEEIKCDWCRGEDGP